MERGLAGAWVTRKPSEKNLSYSIESMDSMDDGFAIAE